MTGERIRQLRLERGLSLAELAQRIGVSQGHLSRVEAGLRGLRYNKMELLARTLGVPVGEMLTSQVLGYVADLAFYTPPKGSVLEKALSSSTQKVFKARSDVLSELGITEGDPVIAEMAGVTKEELKSCDAVVAEITPHGEDGGVLLLRQYIAPNLLVTNSFEQNAMPIHMDKEKARILGRVLL